MGKIVEKEIKKFVFTKTEFVDEIFSGVDPGVAVSDIEDISIDEDDPGSYIMVKLLEENEGQEKTTRIFTLTKADMVEGLIEEIDGDVIPSDVANVLLDGESLTVELVPRIVAEF